MSVVTVRNMIATPNWWIEELTSESIELNGDVKYFSLWVVHGGDDGRGYSRRIAEFEFKGLAEHVVRVHNRAARAALAEVTA